MSKTFVIAGSQQQNPPTELSLRLDGDKDVEIVASSGETKVALGYFNPRSGRFVRYSVASDLVAVIGITTDDSGRIAFY